MSFHFNRISILIVEDTPPLLKLVSAVLETLGVGRILKAANGEQGYKIFCAENPDIVITDWHMNPINGLELTQLIRKGSASPNKTVPIIMMTGYSAIPRVAQARDMGTTEFLVKPFSASDLARRIAYVINKPRDFIHTSNYFGPDRRRLADDSHKGPFRRHTDL